MFSAYRTACFQEALLSSSSQSQQKKMQKVSLCARIRQNFDLNSVSSIYFWKSEWEHPTGSSSIIFIFYRLIFALFFLATLVLNFFCSDFDVNLWFIFATHWSYLIQTIYSIVSLWVVFRSRCSKAQTSQLIGSIRKLPLAEKLNWILYSIVSMVPIGVTIIYWIGIYEPKHKNTCVVISNFTVHAVNSMMVLLDTAVVATPLRTTHFIFGFLFMISYVLFTIFYEIGGGVYAEGKTAIYDILDWKNTGTTTLLTIGIIIIFVSCYFVFGLGFTKLRQYIANKLIHKDYHPL